MTEAITSKRTTCRILCLDGGGSKGTYTLGVLHQVEAMLKKPLCEHFDMVYGTSTGAIIASMIALGMPVDDIYRTYLDKVPKIMGKWFASSKSHALKELAEETFGDKKFDAFKTRVGIIALDWRLERPMIFKTNVDAAFGGKATFVPGFGCTIAEAVRASSAATPFFKSAQVRTKSRGDVETIDGGFIANNPSVVAIVDALATKNSDDSLKWKAEDLNLLSVGCGRFPEKDRGFFSKALKKIPTSALLQKVLSTNAIAIEQQVGLAFPKVKYIRVNQGYETPDLATDFLEKDQKKLRLLYERGLHSFEAFESKIKELFLS